MDLLAFCPQEMYAQEYILPYPPRHPKGLRLLPIRGISCHMFDTHCKKRITINIEGERKDILILMKEIGE